MDTPEHIVTDELQDLINYCNDQDHPMFGFKYAQRAQWTLERILARLDGQEVPL